ncbi:MAG TPA: TonB family protein [Candidatus Acidoferrales bacterium]
MRFRLAVFLVILCTVAASARPQTPADPAKIAQIHHLLDIMDIANNVVRGTTGSLPELDKLTDSLMTWPGSPPEVLERAKKRQELSREIMLAKFHDVDFVDLLVPIYDRHYSLDDINALIAFYQTPTGRRTLEVEPLISVEVRQSLTPILLTIMKDTQEQMKREHPELDAAKDPRPNFGPLSGGVVGGISTAAPPPPPPPGGRPMRITKGGDVAAATATNKVAPVYPELARQAHVEGIVRLHTVIDNDGNVIEVAYVSGPAMLVQAAIDAVKQWRFHPTILNGVPVQVECVLEINFRLGQ